MNIEVTGCGVCPFYNGEYYTCRADKSIVNIDCYKDEDEQGNIIYGDEDFYSPENCPLKTNSITVSIKL